MSVLDDFSWTDDGRIIKDYVYLRAEAEEKGWDPWNKSDEDEDDEE